MSEEVKSEPGALQQRQSETGGATRVQFPGNQGKKAVGGGGSGQPCQMLLSGQDQDCELTVVSTIVGVTSTGSVWAEWQ